MGWKNENFAATRTLEEKTSSRGRICIGFFALALPSTWGMELQGIPNLARNMVGNQWLIIGSSMVNQCIYDDLWIFSDKHTCWAFQIHDVELLETLEPSAGETSFLNNACFILPSHHEMGRPRVIVRYPKSTGPRHDESDRHKIH